MPDNGYQLAPIERIKVKENIRSHVDDESIAGLAQTFKEIGVLQPLIVDRDMNLVDGHRRRMAALKAGLKNVPVIVVEKELAAPEVLLRQLVATLHSEDVKPLDKARAIDGLLKATGCTATQAAVKLGISNATVSRLLTLLQLPPDVQKQVETGAIAASAAYELAQVADPQQRAELAAQAAGGRLTRDAISGRRKQAKRQASSSDGPSRALVRLAPGQSVTICSAGLTLEACVELVEQLLGKLREARKRAWTLQSFLKVQDDLSKQTSIEVKR